METRSLNHIFLLTITGLLIFSFASASYAQRKGEKHAHVKRRTTVVRLPGEHQRIVVHNHSYYFHQGVFYRKGPRGYVITLAPIGARIRFLPRGYITLHFGAIPYFYYYGTYYRYYPEEKVYVVVENPRQNNPEYQSATDILYMTYGRTLEGVFLGGTQSTIQFETKEGIQEIPVAEVISISFAPPVDDNNE
jgi:hypothetical protein